MSTRREKIIKITKVALPCIFVAVFIAILFFIKRPSSRPLGPKLGSASSFYDQGLMEYEEGDYGKAINNFDKVLTIKPNNVDAYIKKSEAEYLAGDKSAALKTVEEGLVRNPDDSFLKNKRDILQKEWFNNPDQETPKQ